MNQDPPPGWTEVNMRRWERADGAVVLYDYSTQCSTSKPWLKAHRGYKAFGPGADEFNFLAYPSGGHRRLRVAIKFKRPFNAMKAVDRAFPQAGIAS